MTTDTNNRLIIVIVGLALLMIVLGELVGMWRHWEIPAALTNIAALIVGGLLAAYQGVQRKENP